MEALDRLLSALVRVLCHIGMAALAVLMMLVTVVDVALRPFGMAVPGAYEIVTLAMRIFVPLVLPYVFWTSSHLTIDLFFDKAPISTQKVLARAADALGAVVMTYLTVAVSRRALTVWRGGELSTDLAVPVFWYWLPLVLGCALSAVVATYLAVRGRRTAAPGAPA